MTLRIDRKTKRVLGSQSGVHWLDEESWGPEDTTSEKEEEVAADEEEEVANGDAGRGKGRGEVMAHPPPCADERHVLMVVRRWQRRYETMSEAVVGTLGEFIYRKRFTH